MNFKKTKLATAVGTAALAMGLSAPANAVVVGGDNGWEVSFTGTINLFFNYNDIELETSAAANTGVEQLGSEEGVHLQEGLLPAFFTFKAKSPTVNGLTGTAQISFAPDSSSAKNTRQDKGGAAIDMREVFFNVDGSFGTISAGRTLGMFSRNAILKDQTLFGVGANYSNDGGGTTLGRIGAGYVYPEFRTRFAYATPVMNGFQLEVGMFDPQEPTMSSTVAGFGAGSIVETDVPMFQGEVNYKTTFQGGNIHAWVSGIWQDMSVDKVPGFPITGDDSITSAGWEGGLDVSFGGFDIWGHYYDGQALGTLLKWSGGGLSTFYMGSSGTVVNSPGFLCSVFYGCEEADNDGFIVQGSYTFNGKTKVAVSYGETNQDSENNVGPLDFNDVETDMWVVGVYHDVTPWLKVVAEYMEVESQCSVPVGNASIFGCFSGNGDDELSNDAFSVGGFIFW